MPSAPSVSIAPFDAQTIGLTDWDNDIAVGGLTYRATRFALGDATSSQDFSQGKGGFALGNQIDHISLENGLDGGGLLSSYVDSGAIPLNGAIAQLLDETGAITVQTWVLCEKAVDGATLSFSLRTFGYMSTKRVRFPASRDDGAINVGVVIGDAEVQGLNATGRYKGASAPTSANGTINQVYGKTLTAWNYGNPASPIIRHQDRLLTASEIVTTNIVANATTDRDGNRDFWSPSRIAFAFDFETQAELDDFWNNYIGYDPSKSSPWSNLQPNTSLIISDGTNSETIIRRDENGAPRLGDFGAPIAGVDQSSVPSKSVIMLETSDGNFIGTAQARKGTNNIDSDGNALPIINEPLLFAKSHTKRNVNFGISIDVYTLFIAPIRGGQLSSASDPESVSLYISKAEIPVCLGATSVVGFQKTDGSNGVATIVVPAGVGKVLDSGLLTFTPTIVSIDGFHAWVDIDLRNKIALYAYSAPGLDFSALFEGNIKSIADENSYGFAQKILCGGSANSGDARIIQFAWKVKLKESTDIGFTPDYLFVDHAQTIDIVAGQDYTRVVPMLPFISDNSDYSHYVWAKYNPSTGNHDIKTEETYIINLWGKGERYPSHIFGSVKDLNNSPICKMMVYANSSNAERSAIARYQSLHIYAVVKLSFGSNPAVVIPGNFPGTSNPTTTPILAATQLASWLGLAPKLTGGITPSSGTWGEYIGASPDEDDTTYGKQRLGDLLEEAWIYGQEANSTAKAPDLEVPEYPVLPPASVDDLVTEPSWDYDYAGTSKQFTAAIKNVGESFDISKGDGYFWGGWQEKDACHFSASPGSSVLAMCQMEDCLAVVCADGYLRCSYDGGVTWPFSQLLASNPVGSVVIAGNGVMVASAGGNLATVVSFDAGRTWDSINIMVATFRGGWFDATTRRLWLCGSLGGQYRCAWYSTDGTAWTQIASAAEGAFVDIEAIGDNIFATAQNASSELWSIFANTISGGTIWSYLQLGSHTDWYDRPHFARWDGLARIAIGSNLWSSSDLSTWTSVATPAPLQAFATDGKVVSALVSESAGGNHVYYSRDQGLTWKAVQISPEGMTWVSTGSMISIWDDNAKCFRLSWWGPARIVALGDPSVLDIWHRCRASCLANSNTIATATYKMPGLYDSFELLRWLLDCKDGTDSEYEQARIDWITKGARFVTLRGRYSSIVDQLSVAAGLPITIPRKILTYSGNAANIPTTGIVSKATHHLSGDDKGLSEIEIIMPPL